MAGPNHLEARMTGWAGSCSATERFVRDQPLGTWDWQLFNLAQDPGEQHDLSGKFPEKTKALVALWDEYVAMNGVIIGDRSPFERTRKGLPDPVPESDDYPPLRGLEALPYERLIELMGK